MKLIFYDCSSNFILEMWVEKIFFHRAKYLATPACLLVATDRFRSFLKFGK